MGADLAALLGPVRAGNAFEETVERMLTVIKLGRFLERVARPDGAEQGGEVSSRHSFSGAGLDMTGSVILNGQILNHWDTAARWGAALAPAPGSTTPAAARRVSKRSSRVHQ